MTILKDIYNLNYTFKKVKSYDYSKINDSLYSLSFYSYKIKVDSENIIFTLVSVPLFVRMWRGGIYFSTFIGFIAILTGKITLFSLNGFLILLLPLPFILFYLFNYYLTKFRLYWQLK